MEPSTPPPPINPGIDTNRPRKRMRADVRGLVAFGIGFVAYRLSGVAVDRATAAVIGLIMAGVAWALIGLANG